MKRFAFSLAVLPALLSGVIFAQAPARKYYANPSDQAAADKEAAVERSYQQRTAGMLTRPLFTSVELTNGIRYRVTVLGVKPEGLLIDASEGIRKRTQIVLKEALGLEDRVRFGFGTPDEQAAVAKINAERERQRIKAEKLELLRRQTEATEAVADELYRREQNRIIFGK